MAAAANSSNRIPLSMPSSSSSCTSSTPAATARSTSIYDSISSCRISVYDPNASHFRIPVIIAGLNRSLRTPAMIDSGATALFINRRFVEKHKIFKHPLAHPIGVNNIDGTANKAGRMTHFARLKLTVGQRTEPTEFLITDLGPEDIILGLPWLKKVNPDIDWENGEIDIPSGPVEPPPPFQKFDATRQERRQWLRAGIIDDMADELWIAAGVTLSTELAAKLDEKKYGCSLEEMVPAEYLNHRKVFSEEESH